MIRSLFFLCGILFCSILFAGTRDPNTSDSKYLDYGSKFHCVLKIEGQDHKDQKYFASCVAINKNCILTAAHVVQDCKACYVVLNDKKYCIEKVICPSDYEENKFGYHDIAIGYLEADTDLGLDFYPELYSKTDETGKVCAISGFGLTGTFRTGTNQSDDKRRAGSNKINHIDRQLLICSPSVNNRTELEFLIGSGDSGGGLFIDNKLAGINSCVISNDGKPNSSYNDESGHTRISQHLQWIQDNLRDHYGKKEE